MTELFRNWPDDSVAIADEVIEWAPAAMHCVAIGTKRTYRGDLLFCTWGDSGTSRRVGNTVGLGNGFLERHWLSCNDARSMRHTLFCSSCELLKRITARC
jgi:hypothetical protein